MGFDTSIHRLGVGRRDDKRDRSETLLTTVEFVIMGLINREVGRRRLMQGNSC